MSSALANTMSTKRVSSIGSPVVGSAFGSTLGSPVVGGVTTTTVGGPVITTGGIRASALASGKVFGRGASLSPVARATVPATTTTTVTAQPTVVQALPQPSIVGGNLGPGVVTSQTVGTPFSLPTRTVTVQQGQTSVVTPTHATTTTTVHPGANVVYQQAQQVNSQVLGGTTSVVGGGFPLQTTTTVVEETHPGQTVVTTETVEGSPQTWNQSGVAEVRPARKRGFGYDTQQRGISPCSPCSAWCPWWLWLLLGLLLLTLLALGLFKMLAAKSGQRAQIDTGRAGGQSGSGQSGSQASGQGQGQGQTGGAGSQVAGEGQ